MCAGLDEARLSKGSGLASSSARRFGVKITAMRHRLTVGATC
jgi:hypothetical protein